TWSSSSSPASPSPAACGPASHSSACANTSRDRANTPSGTYSGIGLLLSVPGLRHTGTYQDGALLTPPPQTADQAKLPPKEMHPRGIHVVTARGVWCRSDGVTEVRSGV